MKAYLINLDRAADRLAHMRREFAAVGLEFERVPAIDGATLGADIVEDFRRNRTESKPDGWMPPEIGCFLGHFETWTRVAQGADEWAAVFEDDVHLSKDVSALLATTDWIPSNADIVRLEGNRSMRLANGRALKVAPGRKVYRALSGTPGSAGYVLSRDIAAWLLEVPPRLHSIPDVFLFKPKVSAVARKLRRYQIVPALCIQDEVLHRGRNAQMKSEIRVRNTRGRGYREHLNPLLRLWPIQRYAVPFRP